MAKIRFMATYGRKLKERTAIIEQDQDDIASMVLSRHWEGYIERISGVGEGSNKRNRSEKVDAQKKDIADVTRRRLSRPVTPYCGDHLDAEKHNDGTPMTDAEIERGYIESWIRTSLHLENNHRPFSCHRSISYCRPPLTTPFSRWPILTASILTPHTTSSFSHRQHNLRNPQKYAIEY